MPSAKLLLCFLRAALILTRLMRASNAARLLALLALAACAALGAQNEFVAGRRALLRGEADNALGYFERIARSDPAFVSDSVMPAKTIWTYLGRAHYNSGRYDAAKSAFDQALSRKPDDHVARMYLGLTLLRPPVPVAPPNAFSLQDMIFALREGVEPKRVATLARERGVRFDITRETETQLREAGADPGLLDALKKLRSEAAAHVMANQAIRAQGAKELSAGLSGLRDWLNDMIATNPQGKFWDPAQEIRKQIQVTLQQAATQPGDWEGVIANAESIGFRLEEESDRARRDETTVRNRLLWR
jgi:tetratricopeptide (TPR) repeat protein